MAREIAEILTQVAGKPVDGPVSQDFWQAAIESLDEKVGKAADFDEAYDSGMDFMSQCGITGREWVMLALLREKYQQDSGITSERETILASLETVRSGKPQPNAILLKGYDFDLVDFSQVTAQAFTEEHFSREALVVFPGISQFLHQCWEKGPDDLQISSRLDKDEGNLLLVNWKIGDQEMRVGFLQNPAKDSDIYCQLGWPITNGIYAHPIAYKGNDYWRYGVSNLNNAWQLGGEAVALNITKEQGRITGVEFSVTVPLNGQTNFVYSEKGDFTPQGYKISGRDLAICDIIGHI